MIRDALPSYTKAPTKRKTTKRTVKTTVRRIGYVVVALLIVTGAIVGWARWNESNQPDFAFGDGLLDMTSVQSGLVDISGALTSDAALIEAYNDGDPYLLVTRLAEWSDGWYRLDLATEAAYGVAVRENGDVIIARVDSVGQCFLTKVSRFETVYSGGVAKQVVLDDPVSRFAAAYNTVCDPSGDGYLWGNGF